MQHGTTHSRKNGAMKKLSEKLPSTTTVRLPVELHAEIKKAAKAAGHSMNVEIVKRLSEPPENSLAAIAKQNVKTHDMIQQIIDAITPRRQ